MPNTVIVRQFISLCRGTMPVGRPQIHGILRISQTFRLCTRCNSCCNQDEILFTDGVKWQICRLCRQLYENGTATEYAMQDDGKFNKFNMAEGPRRG